MITLTRVQHFLIHAFVFLGPLGVLITPQFLPQAFRGYHLLLLFFPILLINLKASEWKALLTFIPFLSYCLISAYFTENKPVSNDTYPFFRGGLLIAQYLFMFGAAFCLSLKCSSFEKDKLLRLYLSGYVLSLIVGYTLFIGFYMGFVSLSTIRQLTVEAQIGWGLLRFSPGSYPNEYGNVSSFVLAVLALYYAEKRKAPFFMYILMSMTFTALLLTTTRAAYLSFIITFTYLSFASKEMRRFSFKLLGIGVVVISVLKHYSVNFINIFIQGIKSISLETGSSGVRITEWVKGFEELQKTPFLGTGFGNNIAAHNVYLELLYELGILGFSLLLLSLIYYLSENHLLMRQAFLTKKTRQERFYNHVTVVGLIHVTLFACTNHNMHHHLTWFIFLLFNMSLFAQQESSTEAPKGDAPALLNKQRLAPRFLQ